MVKAHHWFIHMYHIPSHRPSNPTKDHASTTFANENRRSQGQDGCAAAPVVLSNEMEQMEHLARASDVATVETVHSEMRPALDLKMDCWLFLQTLPEFCARRVKWSILNPVLADSSEEKSGVAS